MKVNCVENIEVGHFLIRKMNNKLADISKVVEMKQTDDGYDILYLEVINRNNLFHLTTRQLTYLMSSGNRHEVYSDIKDVMELYPEEFI